MIYLDNVMKKKFNDFPKINIADATCNLNVYRMPVYLQAIVDSTGETEIVSVFLVTGECCWIISYF